MAIADGPAGAGCDGDDGTLGPAPALATERGRADAPGATPRRAETPPPLPAGETPFQLGLDGEMLDWPAAEEAAVSIVADGVQLGSSKSVADAACTSLTARLAKVAEQPRFDATGYAAYRRHIEEAVVEIVHREVPPPLPLKRPEPCDSAERFLRALKGE